MSSRGRPKKQRVILQEPRINQFSPRGKPGRPDEANLGLDELEALRLADLDCLTQKDAASSMNISQQTFSRIIRRARKKLADAVVNGKIIRIDSAQIKVAAQQEINPINS